MFARLVVYLYPEALLIEEGHCAVEILLHGVTILID